MADSFHSARMPKLCLAHQRRENAKGAKIIFPKGFAVLCGFALLR